jgi:hypothetical protein
MSKVTAKIRPLSPVAAKKFNPKALPKLVEAANQPVPAEKPMSLRGQGIRKRVATKRSF